PRRGDYGQQEVRLGPAGGDDGPRRPEGRHRRGDRGRRHGVDDRRALRDGHAPRGRPQRPRRQRQPHDDRPARRRAPAAQSHAGLKAGTAEVIVAGGVESMTGAPYVMAKHRGGARIGHDVIVDSMMMDGLEDAYEPGKAMGVFAEDAARKYQFAREQMDAYAVESLTRAKAAIASGAFQAEIVPVEVQTRKGAGVVSEDEQPGKADPAKIPTLRPAFAKDGAITAANASSISDGAAAVVMTRESVAKALGLPIVARVVSHAAH